MQSILIIPDVTPSSKYPAAVYNQTFLQASLTECPALGTLDAFVGSILRH